MSSNDLNERAGQSVSHVTNMLTSNDINDRADSTIRMSNLGLRGSLGPNDNKDESFERNEQDASLREPKDHLLTDPNDDEQDYNNREEHKSEENEELEQAEDDDEEQNEPNEDDYEKAEEQEAKDLDDEEENQGEEKNSQGNVKYDDEQDYENEQDRGDENEGSPEKEGGANQNETNWDEVDGLEMEQPRIASKTDVQKKQEQSGKKDKIASEPASAQKSVLSNNKNNKEQNRGSESKKVAFEKPEKSDDPNSQFNFHENIDINKIKKSKLYQKFLKEADPKFAKDQKPQDKRVRSQSPPEDRYERQDEVAPQKAYSPRRDSPIRRSEKNLRPYDEPPRNNESLDGEYLQTFESSMSPSRSKYDSYGRGRLDMSNNAESTINLNLNASSKYIAVPSQYSVGGINSFQNVPGYGRMPGFVASPQSVPYTQFSYESQKPQEYNESNDAFLLRNRIQELSQNLNRETEINRMLEAKCHEYMNQLDKSAGTLEEYKKKFFDQTTAHQEELSTLHDKIRVLNERLDSKDKDEEQLREELSSMKRKFLIESNSKARMLEENTDLEKKVEDLLRMKRDREDTIEQKEEEISRLRKQIDADRSEISYLRGVEDKMTLNIKELNYVTNDLTAKNGELIKILEERDQKIAMIQIENDNLKSQNGNMRSQYNNLMEENEDLKREAYNLKERSLEAENDFRAAQLQVDKMKSEIKQLRDALRRTEENLDRERKKKMELLSQQSTTPEPERRDYEEKYDKYNRDKEVREKERDREYDDYQYKRGNRNQPVEIHSQSNNIPEKDKVNPEKYGYDYKITKSFERKDRSLDNDYSKYEANKNYDQYQAPIHNLEKPAKKGPSQAPFYNDDPSSYKGRDHDRRDVSRDKSPDYVLKYEAQFEKFNKNQKSNNIFFGDPAAEKPKPQNQNANQQNKKPTAINNFVEERDNPPKIGSTTPNLDKNANKASIQYQVYRPTRGLLEWQENEQDNKDVKAKKKDDYRELSPTKNAPFSTHFQDDDISKSKGLRGSRKPEPNKPKETAEPPKEKKEVKDDRGIESIRNTEKQLMSLQIQRDNINDELQKLEKNKIKSAALIKRKQELEQELGSVQSGISNAKNKLRELNVLHPH